MTDMPDVFSPLIELAIELSAKWHDGTFRKSRWRDPAFDVPNGDVLRVPVIAHLTNVAMLVQRAGWDDITVAAAFLHDAIEDDNRFGQTLRIEELHKLMGEEVAARVRDVTERQRDDNGVFLDWKTRKEGYLAHLKTAPVASVAVSLADKLHNLWTMNQSLEQGMNIFEDGPERRGLSAGPERQNWFISAVLDLSMAYDDARLVPLRDALRHELERFERLADRYVS